MAYDRKYFVRGRDHQEILRNPSEILHDLDFIPDMLDHFYAKSEIKLLLAERQSSY